MSAISTQLSRTVKAHQLSAVVGPGGTVRLDGLPFAQGSSVDVLILQESKADTTIPLGSLQGTVIKDADPFGPATPVEDWDAGR